MNLVQHVEDGKLPTGTLVKTTTAGLTRYGVVLGKSRKADPRMVKVSWLWRADAPFSTDKLPYACFMYENFLEVVY